MQNAHPYSLTADDIRNLWNLLVKLGRDPKSKTAYGGRQRPYALDLQDSLHYFAGLRGFELPKDEKQYLFPPETNVNWTPSSEDHKWIAEISEIEHSKFVGCPCCATLYKGGEFQSRCGFKMFKTPAGDEVDHWEGICANPDCRANYYILND